MQNFWGPDASGCGGVSASPGLGLTWEPPPQGCEPPPSPWVQTPCSTTGPWDIWSLKVPEPFLQPDVTPENVSKTDLTDGDIFKS